MLKEYLEEQGTSRTVIIPAGDLFYFITPETLSEYIENNNKTGKLMQELEAYDTIPSNKNKKLSYEMGMLTISWEVRKIDECAQYIKTFPDPIPNIYQIPTPIVENLISSDGYKMQIKQEEGELILRKNVAGVYKADKYDNPRFTIEQIIREKSGSRVEFMRIYQHKMIFKILELAV